MKFRFMHTKFYLKNHKLEITVRTVIFKEYFSKILRTIKLRYYKNYGKYYIKCPKIMSVRNQTVVSVLYRCLLLTSEEARLQKIKMAQIQISKHHAASRLANEIVWQ